MTAELTELNKLVAEFPPQLVQRVIDYARKLKDIATGDIEMGELTVENMQAEANRAMRRFDEEHPGEDWSEQPFTPGYK